MTETEWLAAADSYPMLDILRGRATERKLRLFGCACYRRLGDFLASKANRSVVSEAERYADRQATLAEVTTAWGEAFRSWGSGFSRADGPDCPDAAAFAWRASTEARFVQADLTRQRRDTADEAAPRVMEAEATFQAHAFRDIFGDPFLPLPRIDPAWLAWDGGTVRRLARAIYDAPAFDRMSVLGNCLEEAGCADAALLGHCRSGAEHVRGCWVVDLLLARV